MDRRIVVAGVLACQGLLGSTLVGCGEGETGGGAQNVVPAQKSRRGETCSSRNDCTDGLSCVQSRCIADDYPVEPTAKECVLVECATEADCCADFVPDFSCAEYDSQCQLGDQFYCDLYQDVCVCSAACVEERCVAQGAGCTSDAECGGFFCEAGACVQCRSNENCTDGLLCVNNACQTGCTRNEECALFHSCQNGECVETGCTSDRECILFTKRPDAECKDAVCTVACETNAECGELQICDDGTCLFIGCETNEECRTYLGVAFSDLTAVCRDAP
jgi:hypothetical protein